MSAKEKKVVPFDKLRIIQFQLSIIKQGNTLVANDLRTGIDTYRVHHFCVVLHNR